MMRCIVTNTQLQGYTILTPLASGPYIPYSNRAFKTIKNKKNIYSTLMRIKPEMQNRRNYKD